MYIYFNKEGSKHGDYFLFLNTDSSSNKKHLYHALHLYSMHQNQAYGSGSSNGKQATIVISLLKLYVQGDSSLLAVVLFAGLHRKLTVQAVIEGHGIVCGHPVIQVVASQVQAPTSCGSEKWPCRQTEISVKYLLSPDKTYYCYVCHTAVIQEAASSGWTMVVSRTPCSNPYRNLSHPEKL